MLSIQDEHNGILSHDVTIGFELVRRIFDDYVGEWHVRSITFSDKHLSHTMKFSNEKYIYDVVCKPISDFILSYTTRHAESDVISSRIAEYSDKYVILRGVMSTAFDPFDRLQKCYVKIQKSFGRLQKIFKSANLFSHFDFIGDYLPAKIAQDVVLPLFRLSRIAEDSFIHKEDEILAEETISNIRSQRDMIARYLDYYDRYLAGNAGRPSVVDIIESDSALAKENDA